MKILDYLKKLFKISESNEAGLINVSDSFILPSRKTFRKDKPKIELLNEYKNEYNNILSNKKYITSEDLNTDYLKE